MKENICPIFILGNIFSLKISFSQKSYDMLQWQWLMNMCTIFQKWLSYDIKHVEDSQICPFSLDFSLAIFYRF